MMGLVFEELIRKFAEISNETAGEHFTPREVIRLMVNLLFVEDDDVLSKPGVVRTIYDPTAGTGGIRCFRRVCATVSLDPGISTGGHFARFTERERTAIGPMEQSAVSDCGGH